MPTVSKGVERGWIGQFDAWMAEVESQGGNISVISGYRSPEKQKAILADPVKYGVAPGTPIAEDSDHSHGHALDLQMDEKTKAIAKRLAGKYGIFNNIPKDPNHWYIPRDKNAKGTYSPGVNLDGYAGEEPVGPQPLPLIDRMEVLASMLNPTGSRPDTTADTSGAIGGVAPPDDPTAVPEIPDMQGGGEPTAMRNPGSGSTKENQKLGQQLAQRYGWGEGKEWQAFNELVMRESGWDARAANPTSSARGIAQNIQGYSEGYQEGNAEQQINWMLDYVKNRYGSPSAAIAFHDQKNWY